MAYDENAAQRLRAELGTLPGLTEKKMFGGIASCSAATWRAACSAMT